MAIVTRRGRRACAATTLLDITLILALLLPGVALTKPAVLPGKVIAQAEDLTAPPSPAAIVTTPPPAPLPEIPPAPFPGYAWDPGHWVWNGAQYVWEPGKYIVQPTFGATFMPGYWQEYPGGWAWREGRWSWGTQGVGE
jgi:hypothetical protein